ncbi:MAG: adenosylhopane nucleosidase [Bradyrhizobiaceae bacterium]|nr:adenosylhopane nucleosidase [Bradyrhizobiaceae bacterium]
MSNARSVIALVGLSFEARIAAGPGVHVVCRDAGADLAGHLNDAIKRGCRSIISFGVAGGLAPHLRAGDWIVASSIIDSGKRKPTDIAWSQKLLKAIPGAGFAVVAGVDAPVSDPALKREWHMKTGAAAVDMESHIVARLAAVHSLAFAAIRVIVDPAHRTVPAAALAGMRADGKTDPSAVLRALCAAPSEALGLMRVAADAFFARNALQRGRRLLGPSLGLGEGAHTDPVAVAAATRREPGILSGLGEGIPHPLAAEKLA